MTRRFVLLFSYLMIVLSNLFAQESRLLRFPVIHGNQIVFTYSGDLYTVSATGGVARKLTNDIGFEMFAHFSPDGKQIAFTGQYRWEHRSVSYAGRRRSAETAHIYGYTRPR